MSAVAERTDDARPRWPGDAKDFRVTMGLHPCPPEAWLWRGAGADDLIRAKQQTLVDRHHDAVAVTDAGDAAAREAAALLRAELSRTSPARFHADPATDVGGESACAPVARADAAAAAGMHPLEAYAREVAEDICILTPTASQQGDQRYTLTAAVLCAPSRWSLHEKLGLDVTAIHGPVPGYDAIAAPTARFFERLRVDDIIERTNWTVLDSPVLFQPDRAQATLAFLVAGAAEAPVRLDLFWLRLERQTLRKLPDSGAVVFTILTSNTRLDDLAKQDAQAARELAHKMRTAPAATCAYKGWEAAARCIADALEAACSAA